MCGIAGILRKSGSSDSQAICRVLRRLEHRGPDDCGILRYRRSAPVELGRQWTEGLRPDEVVFIHRRLSILDLSQSGWQPMGTPDGRYYTVFNGEVYNYLELREELQRLGYRFHSQSDTEVVLAAYAEWGTKALNRFVGMFAFALLDTQAREILFARDFFGIKPFYYTASGDTFAFASEIKALFDLGGVSREVDRDRLLLYLRHGTCKFGSATMFAEVHQLPPAHYLLLSLDGDWMQSPVCYWRPEVATNHDIGFDEAADRLRELFLQSVSLHLRSDVPLGSALSGGIDSSAVVMGMRALSSTLELHTFSYIADEKEVSEERWVDIVGSAAGAHVHKTKPDAAALTFDLDRLIDAQDEPFGSTSLYAQFCVFRLARQAGIKVMLDGQGADEVLGGYRFYMGARLASLLRQGHWGQALDFMSKCSGYPDVNRSWLTFVAGEHLLPPRLHPLFRRIVGKSPSPPWLKRSWFHDDEYRSVPGYGSSSELLKQRLYRTLTESTLPNLLRYEDRNSMAFSIESRVPFLTPELVNFVLSLPEHFIIDEAGVSKAVFRRAMRGVVPDAILDRKDKIGFATPENRWLVRMHSWVDQILGSDTARSIPFLDMTQIREQWSAIRCGTRAWTPYVWRWVNLIQWTRQFEIQYH